MDSKCRLSAKPDEQIAATSCLIFLGPLTRTPTLDPAHSDIIPAGEKNEIYFSYLKGLETENNLQLGMLLMVFWEMKKREEGEGFTQCCVGTKLGKCCLNLK